MIMKFRVKATTDINLGNMTEQLSVRANIALGRDHSSTMGGTSRALSSPADRAKFHQMRAGFDALLIGGQSARLEPYQKTTMALYVASRSHEIPEKLVGLKNLHWITQSPSEVLRVMVTDGYRRILVEGGINFLTALLNDGLVDEIALTLTCQSPGENQIDIKQLLQGFALVSSQEINDETFSLYRKL